MSIFHIGAVVCSNCGTETEIQRSASVNADLRPDLRAAILDGSFQAADCPRCGTRLRLPPHLTFLELRKECWIAVEPASAIERWPEVERRILSVYDRAFGSGAPKVARDLGANVRPRLAFGWPALREKLIAIDLGLDDITVELLKMSIIRRVDRSPIADESELRLVGAEGEALQFAWFHQVSEEALARLDVPREFYDGIVEESERWADQRERLEGVFLVDLRRFIAGPEARAA